MLYLLVLINGFISSSVSIPSTRLADKSETGRDHRKRSTLWSSVVTQFHQLIILFTNSLAFFANCFNVGCLPKVFFKVLINLVTLEPCLSTLVINVLQEEKKFADEELTLPILRISAPIQA